jgi:hypothetical protein
MPNLSANQVTQLSRGKLTGEKAKQWADALNTAMSMLGHIMKKTAFTILLLLVAVEANAGWYRVTNYVGQIGPYPVHLSIQTYDFGSGLNVEGSYYYDKHRSPIPIYGKLIGNSASLCEIHSADEVDKILVRGSRSGFDTTGCPLRLVFSNDEATGQWTDHRGSFDVKLKRVGSLDDTESGRIDGVVEIPFWGQTKSYMFIGVYKASGAAGAGISINAVRVVNKKTGAIIQDFDPQQHDCTFGFLMTPIYMNIKSVNSGKDEKIGLNCGGMRFSTVVYYSLNKKTGTFEFSFKR